VDAQRIFVKLFLDASSSVAPREVVPVFHGWIQSRGLDEVLVDVADYTHVHHGPGVLLVCHAANYGIELRDGRPGLFYSRKRDMSGSWDERVAASFRAVLAAARKLEEDPALAGRLRFSTREMVFRISDRLLAPNTPETFEAAAPGLGRVLTRLFAGAPFDLAPVGGADEMFTAIVRNGADAPVATLLERVSP
jgi:hypothetical protein